MIKSTYPEDYQFLLKNVYPGLRHSDYVVQYVVRTYTSAEEIRRIMKTQPQKLSLRELYLATRDLEPGSDEYNETFEIAVRMFPGDEVANLNAANAAMAKGDLKGAAVIWIKLETAKKRFMLEGFMLLFRGITTRQ